MGAVGRRDLFALLTASVAISSCASPNPTLYTLGPVTGEQLRGAPKTVVLRQVSMARYLERPQIVRSSQGYRLTVQENDWWGEPIGPMVSRVLAADLSQRLPQSNIFVDVSAISPKADAYVEINIQRMDASAATALAFSAQAEVSAVKPPGLSITRAISASVPIAAPSVQAEVEAMSVAIGRLADKVALMLATVGSGR